MKELLLQLARYNLWANQLLISTIQSLSDEQHRAEVKSSFPSLFTTIQHMWDAESIWWQRVKLSEKVTRPSDEFTGTFQELSSSLLNQDKQWIDWIQQGQEHLFQHEFIYYNSKKEKFKQPIYQMLLHLFNHGTYHRGQLVTMLRQLGIEKIPQTDFIVWSRKK